MQLSLQADYSCRVLMYLALLPPGEKTSIESIASAYRISEHHLVKVAHKLGKLGFIETTRGRNGGIRLARPAADILIGDVIRKTEPGFTLVECMSETPSTCAAHGACGLKPWFAQALKAFLNVLDPLTLAQVITSQPSLARSLGLAPPKLRDSKQPPT